MNEQITTKGNQISLINVNQNIKFYFHAKIFFNQVKIYTHSLILSHQDVATHYANCVTTGIFFKLNIPVKQQE